MSEFVGYVASTPQAAFGLEVANVGLAAGGVGNTRLNRKLLSATSHP